MKENLLTALQLSKYFCLYMFFVIIPESTCEFAHMTWRKRHEGNRCGNPDKSLKWWSADLLVFLHTYNCVCVGNDLGLVWCCLSSRCSWSQVKGKVVWMSVIIRVESWSVCYYRKSKMFSLATQEQGNYQPKKEQSKVMTRLSFAHDV